MLKSLQKLSADADEVVAATIAILQCINRNEVPCVLETQVIPSSVSSAPTGQPLLGHVDPEQIKIWEKKILDAEEGQKIAAISFAKARREMELLAAKNAALEKELEAPAAEISKLKQEIEKLNATITNLQAELEQAHAAARTVDLDRQQSEKAELAAVREKCHEAIETAKKLSIQSEKRKEQRDAIQKERDSISQERDVLQKELAAIQEQLNALKLQLSLNTSAADGGRAELEQRVDELKVFPIIVINKFILVFDDKKVTILNALSVESENLSWLAGSSCGKGCGHRGPAAGDGGGQASG